ncbi:MAG TPA: VWA containing CoxE family protein, partial [Deltaproteobacteria bacterium]|nr:VWA containing CoxE family protein [Deltaproteobacteria bacterium]
AHSRASIWLNPDPKRWWRHPTVEAIGGVFPMFPLTLTGLRDGIKVLRRGH